MGAQPNPDDLLAELHLALAITRERETAQGAPWCPPKSAEALGVAFASLSRDLPGLARQAVRLARVMERAGGRAGYVGFLYGMHALRVRLFVQRLARAEAEGSLRGVARVDGDELVFEETGMVAPTTGSFRLHLTRLPRVAAYLDVVHNMLGYREVAALLEPVLAPECSEGAGEMAGQALARAVDAWVRARVETQHEMRLAAAIRGFLHNRRSGEFRAIDDATILAFWLETGAMPEPPLDGLKKFESAAQLMLGYRRAERLAAEERALDAATSHDWKSGEDSVDPLERAEDGLDYGRFQSPIAGLFSPPADRVTWRNATDFDVLKNWLGASGLFAGDPPDLSLATTVLRVEVFGGRQNVLINDRRRAVADLARSPGGGGSGSYADLGSQLAQLSEALTQTGATAALRLIEAARAEALTLIDTLFPEAGRALLASLAAGFSVNGPQDGDTAIGAGELGAHLSAGGLGPVDLTEVLQDALAQQDLALPKEVQGQMKAAARLNRRKGLVAADLEDEHLVEGLAAGAAPLARLVGWAEKIAQAVGRLDLMAIEAKDTVVFHEAFQRMYGEECRDA